MAKHQRKYRLEIQDVKKDLVIIELPFSINFDINKAIYANVCTGSITVYNLSESTRNSIVKNIVQTDISRMRTVQLYAGYEGQELPSIFKGTISHCYSRRQGVDFLTVIEVNSGSDLLANSYVSMAISSGTTYKDYIAEMCGKINGSARKIVGNFEGVFKRATQVLGAPEKLLKDFTDGNFFIDGDNILVLKDDEAIAGILNEINSDTGLLGSPQREENFLLFDIIFEPRLLMGQWVKLNSSTIGFFKGTYKVVGYHHVGSISETICGTAKTTVRCAAFANTGYVVIS